jgi:hypothetical protein
MAHFAWRLMTLVLPGGAQLITMRETVSARIRQALIKRATDFHLVLEDVSITHLSFGAPLPSASSSC